MESLANQFNKSQLINEFKAVIADAEALLKATANTSGEKIAEVRSKAEKSLSIAKAKLADAQDEVLAKTKAAVKVTDVYVHENPWRSIGLAAGVGVVIGLLIGRR
ncbi:MAG: YqjD family protein [Methylotenera sp.]|nr:YqjD family protein [Methylotenera sp.]MDO9233499.1 YqjD family protein [Methylotenera sp.]MDO9388516.1 YqjD family protein [Methylotenera sp.]MDP1597160.1 YqjD family protein [Methylotenera sp.]MDP1754860.1 YqjD family protein [Methylotenera sp.]